MDNINTFICRGIVTSFAILSISNGASAQSQDYPENKYTYLKNDFTIGYTAGINQSQFKVVTGNDSPEVLTGLVQELNFTYTIKFKKNFSIGLTAGTGFFPFRYSFGDKNEATDLNRTQTNYDSYLHFRPIVKYNQWVNKKWLINGGLGGDIRSISSPGITIFSQDQSDWSVFQYNYTIRPRFYAQFELGIDRLLKNQNRIGLALGFSYSFGDLYQGVYEINNAGQISRGTMRNQGMYPSLSLKYVISRAKNWGTIEESFVNDTILFDAAKRNYQQEKRSIDPRSVFIGVSGGGSATYNKAPADDFIKSSYQIGVKAAFTAEIGTKNNQFLEFGLSRSDYATGYNVKGPFNGEYTFNFLSALELNMGFGWRLISKNKFNFIDVSAGIQLGAHNFPDYLSSFLSDSSSIHLGPNGNGSIVIQSKDEIQTNFIPLIYAKLNKNIRITNYLFFSAAMQYNIGFYPITKKSISYEYAGEQNINRELSLIMNGTGIQFTFGLKYKFVPKK